MHSFWSSDILTGTQTGHGTPLSGDAFWSSDILTGTQTADKPNLADQ